MLGILLGILKCIGWIFLGLILLILALLSIVLFTPIKYRLVGEYKEAMVAEGSVRWLFGIFRVEGKYQDGAEPSFEIYIFGKSLSQRGEEKNARKKKKAQKKKGTSQKKPVPEGAVVARERPPRPKEAPVVKEIIVEEVKIEEVKIEEVKIEEPKVLGQAKAEPSTPKQVRRVKLSEIQEKPPRETTPLAEEDKSFFLGEEEEDQEKEPSFWQTAGGYWEKFQEIPHKKEIFEATKKLLKRLLKGIAPKDFVLKGTVGTGDPVYTGYFMGLMGILTAKFGDHVQVKGEFTRLVAEDIEVFVKGKIVVGSFLWAVLAFVLTKPVRQLLLKLWKGR